MSRKLKAAIAAGALLGVAALVFSLLSFPGVAGAQEESTDGETVAPRALGFLERVLDELVSEGTIDEEDADAVLTAVEEEIQEFREAHPEWAHPRRHLLQKGARIGALLDEGGITQEEYDALPEHSRLRDIDIGDALDDGLITPEELRQIWREHRQG
jgi:polyhydroxyalkanoate synthesis regulator phasin